MTIFGRSKKRDSAPNQPSPSPLYQQSNQTEPLGFSSYTDQNYIHQRPNRSHLPRLPPPQSWLSTPNRQPVQDVAPPKKPKSSKSSNALTKLKRASMSNLLHIDVPASVSGAGRFNDGLSPMHMQGTQYLNQGAALCDLISSKLNEVITLIDGERFSGNESDFDVYPQTQLAWQQQQRPVETQRAIGNGKGTINEAASCGFTSMNYLSKVHLYSNSRLQPDLPPLKLYIPTYPLLCLAAQYSQRVYTKPAGKERETQVGSDWRLGTKAMVIKSVPMDDMNTIVFAIRGSQTFMDWAVNLNSAPASPDKFLDDAGNYCHAGFLTVAQKMIKPVAARLRHLLQEDPSRSNYSLLITGHSAGGAVAALLYSHMHATSRNAESELNILSGCFKRIHCITFGAPPVSILPLTKPRNPLLKKSIFISFVNEGDPVPRADKAYIRSLLDLYSSPVPGQPRLDAANPAKLEPLLSGIGKPASSLAVNRIRPPLRFSRSAPSSSSAPTWPVPEATLSNAGRLVLLRSVEGYGGHNNRKHKVKEMMNEGIVAQMIDDQLLRGVIWGSPECHMMKLYARRIEILATNAVTGRS